jgi:hypothetical protein
VEKSIALKIEIKSDVISCVMEEYKKRCECES